jgi:protein phosphatase
VLCARLETCVSALVDTNKKDMWFMKVVGKSHIGKVRESNQDAFFVSLDGPLPLPNLFIVADGMGGHSAGDIASARAVEAFCDFVKGSSSIISVCENFLAEALAYANSEVHYQSLSKAEHRGMGTTFSAVSIDAHNRLYYVHVGDSRIYFVNKQGIRQITKDHSGLTADMVEQGLLDAEEAKKYPRVVLSRAIGTDEEVRIDKGLVDLKDTQYVLLCSDGLTNMLSDEQIFKIMSAETDLDELCERLVESALDAGGSDNISVIVIGWDNK